MPDQDYNGWTNRDTWVVNLWLSNEEPAYRKATAIVEDGVDVVAKLRELASTAVRDPYDPACVNWPEIVEAFAPAGCTLEYRVPGCTAYHPEPVS